jgi:hypothetical protein
MNEKKWGPKTLFLLKTGFSDKSGSALLNKIYFSILKIYNKMIFITLKRKKLPFLLIFWKFMKNGDFFVFYENSESLSLLSYFRLTGCSKKCRLSDFLWFWTRKFLSKNDISKGNFTREIECILEDWKCFPDPDSG